MRRLRAPVRWGILLLCLLASFGWPSSTADADGPLDAEARAIARSLLCPICENLSVLDSPSPLAQQMRGIIQEKLSAGESREQIIQYFVDRYGEGVLMEPPKHGFSLLVWLGPVLVAMAGVAILSLTLRRWLQQRPPLNTSDGEQPPLDPEALKRLDAELRTRP